MEVKVPKDVDHVAYQDDGDDNEDIPHGLGMGKTVGEDGYQRWKSVPSLNSKWNKAETPPLSVPKSWKATLTAMQASKQASEPSRTGHYVLERLTADMPPSSKMQEKGLMITEGDTEITYEMVFDPEESIDLINDLSTA